MIKYLAVSHPIRLQMLKFRIECINMTLSHKRHMSKINYQKMILASGSVNHSKTT